jgi:hypothetical protein
MSQDPSRVEEFRLDPQQVKDKVKEAARGVKDAALEGKAEIKEFRVSGDQIVGKVKEIVRAGNVRRIVIKSSEGRALIEIPLTLGVVAAFIVPVWAAIGALAALALDYTIAVEKVAE